MILDFALTADLDLDIENLEIQNQKSIETTVMTAFFSDARISNKRGYWSDLILSELWKYDQSRLTPQVTLDLEQDAKEVGNKLVSEGVCDDVEVSAYIESGRIFLNVKCFTNDNLILEKNFNI